MNTSSADTVGVSLSRLEFFGWRGAVEPGIGRVVSAHGDYYHLVCNEAEGEILARKKKSVFTRMKTAAPDDMRPVERGERPLSPVTGDFVRFRFNETRPSRSAGGTNGSPRMSRRARPPTSCSS